MIINNLKWIPILGIVFVFWKGKYNPFEDDMSVTLNAMIHGISIGLLISYLILN